MYFLYLLHAVLNTTYAMFSETDAAFLRLTFFEISYVLIECTMIRRTRKFFSYCLVVRLCHKRWQRLNLNVTPVGDNAAMWIIHIAKETSNRKH